MDCFKNIVGISRTQNACFTGDFNEEAAKSTSGLFMDELPESPDLSVFKAADPELQALLTKARDNACNDFVEALFMELGTRYKVTANTYNDWVGQTSNNGNLSLNYAYAGLAYEMNYYKGALVKIASCLPQFNYDGTLEINVYKAYANGIKYQLVSEIPLKTFTVNTAATSPVEQTIDNLVLETVDDYGKPYTYLFVYVASGHQPKNNSNSCGCGHKEDYMRNYVRPIGINGTSFNDMQLSNRTPFLNGLLFKIDARCGSTGFICKNYLDNQFVRVAMEKAIQLKAASNAIVEIFNSQRISRALLTNREQLGKNVYILNGMYKKRVAWISENMDMSSSDCFRCNPSGGGIYDITKGGIMA